MPPPAGRRRRPAPPIGFGLAFHELVSFPDIPKVTLVRVHRQAEATGIPQVAAAVRAGTLPAMGRTLEGPGFGVTFLDGSAGGAATLDDVVDAVATCGGWRDDLRVLCPTKGGTVGADAVNARLHALLTHGRDRMPGRGFAVGEPVMFLRNDYRLGLRNGSLGTVTGIADGILEADFDGVTHALSGPSLDDTRARLRGDRPQGPGLGLPPGGRAGGPDPPAGPVAGLHGHHPRPRAGRSRGRPEGLREGRHVDRSRACPHDRAAGCPAGVRPDRRRQMAAVPVRTRWRRRRLARHRAGGEACSSLSVACRPVASTDIRSFGRPADSTVLEKGAVPAPSGLLARSPWAQHRRDLAAAIPNLAAPER